MTRRGLQPAFAKVDQQYLPFIGGLHTTSNRLAATPGTVFAAQNYEGLIAGGYRRTGGIERFDGRARPSDASYRGMDAAIGWTCAVGDTVTGVTSGAVATVCYKKPGGAWMAVTNITGTFVVGEMLQVAAVNVGVYTGDTEQVEGFTQNSIVYAAGEVYRAAIGQVPGSGPLRGVTELNGAVYAWRDNADGTACAIYKSSAAGWVAVPLYYELSFSGASTEPAEGATVTKGAVSATVKRVVLESGAYTGGTAAGRLIITAPTGGSFTAGAFTAGMTATVTASYLGTAITLQPGGSFNFAAGVFTAGVRRLYGCDGVNREFEFADDILVPLSLPTAGARASCVTVHAKQLWFGVRHAVLHSAIAFPYVWSALVGAAELGVNSTVTNMVPRGGDATTSALMIYSTAGVHVLYGTSDLDYKLTLLSAETGADPGSAQPMKGAISVSRDGLRVSEATQNYDNFSYESASQRIEGYTMRRTVTCSVLQRARSLYRVFFDDGTGLTGVPAGSELQWMPFSYGFTVTHAWSATIAGIERWFITSDSSDAAYVYEIDVGRSFDGGSITAWLGLHPFTARAPGIRKTFRSTVIEATGESPFTLQAIGEFNYGDPDVLVTESLTVTPTGAAMRWDVSDWDEAVWDGVYASRLTFETRGQGAALGLNIFSDSATELPHTLHGETVNYTVRRSERQ
jgi:hypothetical protein